MNTENFVIFCLVIAAVWVLTLAGLVWLILGVAKLAMARARAQDVPEVLGALTSLITAMPWLGQLSHLVRTVGATVRTGPVGVTPPVIDGTSSGPETIDGPSAGGAQ